MLAPVFYAIDFHLFRTHDIHVDFQLPVQLKFGHLHHLAGVKLHLQHGQGRLPARFYFRFETDRAFLATSLLQLFSGASSPMAARKICRIISMNQLSSSRLF